VFAYIDPGTGSMLFTIIIGIATAAFFALKGLFVKLSFIFHGGTKGKDDTSGLSSYPYVIFSDSKRYWNVFKPICDQFEERGIPMEYWTMSPDDPALSEKYRFVHPLFIGDGNAAFARLNVMKADICLSTTPGLDVYQWKRSKNVRCYVHITHDVCAITGYRMFGVDFYDAILLPNKYLIPQLREIESVRGIPEKEVAVVGSTYMDGLRNQKLNAPDNKGNRNNITVLVAPSWGPSSILNRFGRTFLKALVDTGYDIIVRPHPQSYKSDPKMLSDLKNEFVENEHFSWNADNDNFDVMNRSDILISDFSGVIFDFVFTFGRPMMYADTNLDLSPYDDCWLKEEPWRLGIISELGRKLEEKDFGKLKEVISDCITDNSFRKKRERIIEEAWACQGEAAVRVADYLIEKHTEGTKQ